MVNLGHYLNIESIQYMVKLGHGPKTKSSIQ